MHFLVEQTLLKADIIICDECGVKESIEDAVAAGVIPLVGFKSTSVYYERAERIAGESHYPLKKMLALAFDGITSLSIKPMRMISALGVFFAFFSFIGIIWAVVGALTGSTVWGWASTVCIVCFMGGIQLLCLGVIGEYIGKIYLETKRRPRYIISERTYSESEAKALQPNALEGLTK